MSSRRARGAGWAPPVAGRGRAPTARQAHAVRFPFGGKLGIGGGHQQGEAAGRGVSPGRQRLVAQSLVGRRERAGQQQQPLCVGIHRPRRLVGRALQHAQGGRQQPEAVRPSGPPARQVVLGNRVEHIEEVEQVAGGQRARPHPDQPPHPRHDPADAVGDGAYQRHGRRAGEDQQLLVARGGHVACRRAGGAPGGPVNEEPQQGGYRRRRTDRPRRSDMDRGPTQWADGSRSRR